MMCSRNRGGAISQLYHDDVFNGAENIVEFYFFLIPFLFHNWSSSLHFSYNPPLIVIPANSASFSVDCICTYHSCSCSVCWSYTIVGSHTRTSSRSRPGTGTCFAWP